MHGQIHDSLRLMVLQQYNKDTWQKVLRMADCSDDVHFLKLRHYDDIVTRKLISCISEVLGVTVEDVWLEHGRYFIQYTIDIGYAKMLRSLGPSFEAFVENLDTVHTLLAVSYHDIVPPQFRCVRCADGSLTLHHYSNRQGLSTLIVGLMMGAADLLHGVKLEIGVRAVDTYTTDNSILQHHTTVHIRVLTPGAAQHIYTGVHHDNRQPIEGRHRNNPPYVTKSPPHTRQKDIPTVGHGNADPEGQERGAVCLDPPDVAPLDFCSLFPYHIMFDRDLLIKQVGNLLHNFCPHVCRGEYFGQTCHIVYPRMPLTFAAIRDFERTCFVVGVQGCTGSKMLSLKGQMIPLKESHVMFMCSPVLRTLTELQQQTIYICDLPIYDTTREFVLLNELRQTEIDISSKLEEATAALQRTAAELEAEKAKTDMLLYEMLPVKVVQQLREGKRVEAEKFETSTLLFSDIVTFTKMAAAVSPMDIVRMLNSLYSIFDCLVTRHGVYKVETIGDAYMVVGGVPEPVPSHAQRVALMALDMLRDACAVTSPTTGKSIQIRVGIHTGSVVAGVVGEKMPRYCLFGDTVNTASRMESHGVPGTIHLSFDTYSLLHPLGFKMKKRGRIKVKGKGRMDTYFLLEAPPSGGKTNERLARPSRTGENDKLLSNVCRIT